MIEFSKIKVGEVLSETSYYVVKSKTSNGLELYDAHKNIINIGKEYVEKILSSADQFVSIEEKNQTELIQLVMSNPRVACSIYYQKQDEKKKVGDFKAEKAAKIAEIQNAPVSKVEKLLSDLIDNPILPTIPGAMRLIKGYYTGKQNERGRFEFIDMEDNNVMKQVDPRTMEYVIVNNVKYIKK